MTSKDREPEIIRVVGVERTLPSALDLIRQNRSLYLGTQEPSGTFLAVQLADCALRSGAPRVELATLADGWMAVSAGADWITPNLQGRRDPSMESAFKAIIPLSGGKETQMRFEVIVRAFSKNLSVKAGSDWINIAGTPPTPEIQQAVAASEFSVVFMPEMDS